MLLLVINYRIQLTCKEEMRGRRNAAEVTDLAVPRQNTFDNICSVRAGAFGRGGGWVANNYFRECRRMQEVTERRWRNSRALMVG